MELGGVARRHKGVARSTALLLLAFAVLGGAAPAIAQEVVPVTITAEAGIDGYIRPDRAVSVTVELSSSVLFSGEMRVSVGQQSVTVPVEIPAEIRKALGEVRSKLGAPGASRRAAEEVLKTIGR